MKCSICKHGDTQPGVTTVLLERDGKVVVIRGVPAQICDNCGHAYTSSATTEHVFALAEEMLGTDEQVSVRHYRAA
ncbi:MAG: type II toxin-antitoxin system MqsA family antitoxin [Acidobacteria bacterium]|nr:type II toxin-antitoxin system MqsA family antitoxin [Acidobacteriota bacterium]